MAAYEAEDPMQVAEATNQDSVEDSDDDGILFQQPTVLAAGSSIFNSNKRELPLAPSTNLVWQEDAVLECFQLAVQSHDTKDLKNSPVWNPPSFIPPPSSDTADPATTDPVARELLGWQPTALELPAWAVDLQNKESTS